MKKHGAEKEIAARIDYVDAGLETPIIALVEEAMDPREAARLLAPDRSTLRRRFS